MQMHTFTNSHVHMQVEYINEINHRQLMSSLKFLSYTCVE